MEDEVTSLTRQLESLEITFKRDTEGFQQQLKQQNEGRRLLQAELEQAGQAMATRRVGR